MSDLAAAIEATALAGHLKQSVWTYPLINAGHILGIALLVGAAVAIDLRLLGWRRLPDPDETLALLRPVAAAGLMLAVTCGALLFITQAGDYVTNRWFWAKLGLVAAATFNAVWHRHITAMPVPRQRLAAGLSLGLWPAALICGRMIAYS